MKKLITLAILLFAFSVGAQATAYIYGTLGACVGNSTTLYSDSLSTSGTWTSSNTSVATVGLSTGVVMAVAPGTSTITYVGTAGTATAVYTVSPAPMAISGMGLLCVGSSITLTNPTPGGTWTSLSTYVATIGASTGVTTGMHSGTATIRYTTGAGCWASTMVTVSPGSADSILGSHTVCAGATTSLTLAGSTGGTWSSSNPSIATVSSAGIVTGVSAGTVTISVTTTGICGTVVTTHIMTVTSGPSAGTLSGPSTVTAGSSIYLSSTVSGGAWSSSTTSVATAATYTSTSGTVTGVSAGTSTISYTVTGCGTSAVATKVVTVTPFDGISGHVLFGSTAYYGSVKVWLIKYNPSTLMLTACDSQTLYSSGSSVGYSFASPASDSYRVKAAVYDSMGVTTGYMPTYHTSSAFWYSATVINHTAGTGDINKDINMGYGTVTSGPGFIGGSVTMGANKGTSGSVPAVGLLMYIINESTGAIQQQTLTDASGNYSFSNLPVGQTYKIYPELINYATTPYAAINLTSSSTSMTVASFVQHTISHTITPIPQSVGYLNETATTVSVFPNPASKTINLAANMSQAEEGTLVIADVTGREMYRSAMNMSAGTNNKTVDVTGFAAGLYLVSYNSASVHYVNTVSVQH